MSLSNAQYVTIYLITSGGLAVALALLGAALVRAWRALDRLGAEGPDDVSLERGNLALRRLREVDSRAIVGILVPLVYVGMSGVAARLVRVMPGRAALINALWLAAGVLVDVMVVWQGVRMSRAVEVVMEQGRCLPERVLRKRHYAAYWVGYLVVALGFAAFTVLNIIAVVSDWEKVVAQPFLR